MLRNRVLFLIPVFATLGAIFFYIYSFNLELMKIKYEQSERIKSVSNELNEYVIVSSNLGKFIEKDLNEKNLSKKVIESKLFQYLSSAPANVIYGIGIWFEPYKLQSKQKLNGIYIHQHLIDKRKFTLTYEWNTEEYNYPSQKWYQAGLKASQSVFTDPYYDQGMVYTTNARSFYKEKRKVGVISVDIVVPLLQDLIARHSIAAKDYVFIVDKNEKIVAHFNKETIQESEVYRSKNATSLLDMTEPEIRNLLKLNSSEYFESALLNEKLGWKIKAISSKLLGFSRTQELFVFLFFAVIIVWIAFIYFRNLIFRIEHENNLAREETERNKIQLLKNSKMASLGEMASGVAHEINSPLMVILGKSKQMKRYLENSHFEPSEIKNQIEVIEKTVYRISTIISGLRTFSRSSENDELISENINTIIEDSKALLSEKLKHSNIELSLNKLNDNIYLKCRPGQISQVLLNLISNAHDAVLENEKVEKWIVVNVRLDQIEKKIIIEVSDSGKGISSEIEEKIMNPFFTTKEIGKGTGLGLSISKGIVEEHNGILYLKKNTPNTTFCIELPIN